MGSQVSAQTPVAELIGTDARWVRIALPAGQAQWVTAADDRGTPGSTVIVTSAPGAGLRGEWQGSILRRLPDLDPGGLQAQFLAEIPAAGSGYWGHLSRRVESPLRAYALLELGVVLAALAGFLLTPAFAGLYGALHDYWEGHRQGLLLGAKLLLALVLLSPAAFFMGGTLPVMCSSPAR